MKSAREMFEDVDYIQDENLSIDRYGHKLLIYRKRIINIMQLCLTCKIKK